MFLPIGDDNIKGGHFPIISYGLIALNVLIYIFEASMPPQVLEQFIYMYGSIPAETMQGRDLHTLLTSTFLHGGLMHLIGNMLFLWIFADNIEATIGNFRFLVFYLLGGLAAHALHIFFNPASVVPTVGASGAISAVMGAYLVMFPRSQVKVLFFIFPFRLSAWVFLGLWIWEQWAAGSAAQALATAESAGVAYWAHVGGFVFGVVMGFFYRNRFERPRFAYEEDARDYYV